MVRACRCPCADQPDWCVYGRGRYPDIIGDDYAGYRGHIYRTLSFSLHFLANETHRGAIEAALVYHDIGLWTDSGMLGLGVTF
eukprot:802499-Amorphochlora_amoeboformis.AAC.1